MEYFHRGWRGKIRFGRLYLRKKFDGVHFSAYSVVLLSLGLGVLRCGAFPKQDSHNIYSLSYMFFRGTCIRTLIDAYFRTIVSASEPFLGHVEVFFFSELMATFSWAAGGGVFCETFTVDIYLFLMRSFFLRDTFILSRETCVRVPAITQPVVLVFVRDVSSPFLIYGVGESFSLPRLHGDKTAVAPRASLMSR